MRQPLWLLNSSLLILFLVSLIIVVFTQQKVPRWVTLEPESYIKTIKREMSDAEMAKIYENDLFNTYSRPIEPLVPKTLEQTMPQPPTPQQVRIPQPTIPTFLEPLCISLKGIIIMGDDQKDRAIISNAKTKVESTIKVGDKVEDSQLIRIMKSKIIFIRSNGQEESFYLREKDARDDQGAQTAERWESVIKKIADNQYQIDPESFVELVPDLGQFIASLDLITVYRNGQPMGVKIGTLEPTSFGQELGLRTGDIITTINKIPATTVTNRMKIYDTISSLPMGSIIEVDFMRNNNNSQLLARLEEIARPSSFYIGKPGKPISAPPMTEEDIQERKMQILEQKKTFAPTLDEIRRRERSAILNKVMRGQEVEAIKNKPVNLEI